MENMYAGFLWCVKIQEVGERYALQTPIFSINKYGLEGNKFGFFCLFFGGFFLVLCICISHTHLFLA